MTDVVDRAKEVEALQRESAIKIARGVSEPEQEIINGRVVCIDCDVPIQAARLTAKPNAARCIHCQQIVEEKRKHYGPF